METNIDWDAIVSIYRHVVNGSIALTWTVGWGYTNGLPQTISNGWLYQFTYNRLSGTQQNQQNTHARNNKLEPKHTFVITSYPSGIGSRQLEKIGVCIRKVGTSGRPSVIALSFDGVDSLFFPDDATKARIFHTNVLIHELGHLGLDHCGSSNCVMYKEAKASVFDSPINNAINIPGKGIVTGLPWHSLNELNTLRKGMLLPIYK